MDELNTTLARSLERIIRPCLDLKKLCLIPGSQCWIIYLDALIFVNDGNLLDAICLAARAALLKTSFSRTTVLQAETGETEVEISDDPDDTVPLDAAQVPVCVSLAKVGALSIADATAAEEQCAGARVSVGVSRGGALSTLKGGHGAVDAALLSDMMTRAQTLGQKLLDTLDLLLRREK